MPKANWHFRWLVISFGLKNVKATYQWAMNTIFYDMIGRYMEVYIDNVVVKLKNVANHLGYLRKVLERMRLFKLKMNMFKCSFRVKAGNFLRFLVRQRGMEVDHNKARAIIEAKSPINKKEL